VPGRSSRSDEAGSTSAARAAPPIGPAHYMAQSSCSWRSADRRTRGPGPGGSHAACAVNTTMNVVTASRIDAPKPVMSTATLVVGTACVGIFGHRCHIGTPDAERNDQERNTFCVRTGGIPLPRRRRRCGQRMHGGRHGNVATDGEGERDGGAGDLAWRPDASAAMNTATKSAKACSGEASDVTSGVSIPAGRAHQKSRNMR